MLNNLECFDVSAQKSMKDVRITRCNLSTPPERLVFEDELSCLEIKCRNMKLENN
jgi:hypothetical protein